MILRSLFFILIYVPFMLVALPAQFVVTRLNLPFWHFVTQGTCPMTKWDATIHAS